VKVKIGDQVHEVVFGPSMQDQRIEFHTDGTQDRIDLDIPHPESPSAIGKSRDPRPLGIAVQKLRVAPMEG